VYFEAPIQAIAEANIWSRFGNILYFIVGNKKKCRDFDSYFEAIFSLDWEKYIPKDFEILVKSTSIKSELGSLSSLQ